MSCCCDNKNRITIVRGNDTNFNGQNFVHFNITSSVWDLSTMKATISLGGITKTFTDLSNGIDLNYTAVETSRMPFGDLDGVLKVYNATEQIATIESLLPFRVISIVHGDAIAVTPAEFNIDVKQGGETVMNIGIEAGVTVNVVPEIEMLPVGSDATVTNEGTPNHLLLKFHIPESDSIESIEKTSTEGLIDTYTITWASGKTSTFKIANGNGIESITKTDTSGLVDTYTILFTDGTSTTFEVTNGNGIASIEKTSKEDLVDTYTITYTNGDTTTFNVTNGQDATINGVTTLTLNTTYGISLVQEGNTATISGKEITDVVDRIDSLIPAQASESNQLADKDFVNSSIATNTGNFIGTFESISDRDAYSGTITNNDYCFVINSVVTDNGNDWASFSDLDDYDKSLLTNYDYGWVVNGSNFDLYRFDIVNQEWELRAENIEKDDVSLNTAYNRYKATVAGGSVTWEYEYTLNNSSFTANQWAAINSGATQENIEQISTNENAIGNLSTLTTTNKSSLVGAVNELNTNKLDKVTGSTSVMQAYVKNANGTQGMTNIVQNSASGSSIPIRTPSGTIYTATPTNDGEATNKSYVDTAMSSLDGKKIDKGYAVNDFATDCITQVSQDIKLELSSGTLTLKSGSVITYPDGTQYQTTSDITLSGGSGSKRMVFVHSSGTGLTSSSNVCSGTTDSMASVGWHVWFDTTNNAITQYDNSGTSTEYSNMTFPICEISLENSVITSIDKVFNGAGYIGHHAFTLPNIKGIISNGFNDDGTLKGIAVSKQSLIIVDMGATRTSTDYLSITLGGGRRDSTSLVSYYTNRNGYYTTAGVYLGILPVVLITISSGVITSFINRPVSGLSGDYVNTALGYTAANSTDVGTLANLTTTAKNNLVAAINELDSGKQPSGNYVTTDTAQTITAQKTFNETGIYDGPIIKRDSSSSGSFLAFSNNSETLGAIGVVPSKIPVSTTPNQSTYSLVRGGLYTSPAVGDASTPVYVDSNGIAQPCTNVETKPTVVILSNDDTITLADNTCFRGASITAFTIATPSTDFYPFCCEIDLTSGSTATTITYTGSTILWDANSDDLVNDVFVPVANKKYTLMFWYNGTDYCGTAVGL